MKENRFLVREDIGTDHEIVSYYDSYDEACRYCRGLYNTLYMIQEVKNCDSPKELSLATPQGSL